MLIKFLLSFSFSWSRSNKSGLWDFVMLIKKLLNLNRKRGVNLFLRTVICASNRSSNFLLFFFLRKPIMRYWGILRFRSNLKHIWYVYYWWVQTSFFRSFSCVNHWVLDLIEIKWLTADLNLLVWTRTSWSTLRYIPSFGNYLSGSFLWFWSLRSWLILGPRIYLRFNKFPFSSSRINSSRRMSVQGIVNFAHLINRLSTLWWTDLRFDHSSLPIRALDL